VFRRHKWVDHNKAAKEKKIKRQFILNAEGGGEEIKKRRREKKTKKPSKEKSKKSKKGVVLKKHKGRGGRQHCTNLGRTERVLAQKRTGKPGRGEWEQGAQKLLTRGNTVLLESVLRRTDPKLQVGGIHSATTKTSEEDTESCVSGALGGGAPGKGGGRRNQ